MSRSISFTILAAFAVSLLGLSGCDSKAQSGSKTASGNKGAANSEPTSVELLNASYDPTRELWKDINAAFIPQYEKQSNVTLTIAQSHGGSGSQARAVVDGLDADVVTLAMWGDTNAISKAGLIEPGWEDRLPNGSLPYASTIVFVVRKGNPKQIKDWTDLVREGVEVVTPSPKTSGNGKLSFLSAWGSVRLRGGSEEQALAYVTELYDKRHVPVLDLAARASTVTFAQRGKGDVHLTWENEAHLEVHESKGALELVYPPISILAEPRVAIVDKNVDRRGTRAAAEAYLKFLYTNEGQEIIARHHYRPTNPDVVKKHADSFPAIELFSIKAIAKDWSESDKKFFANGAIFDSIYKK